MKNIISLLFMSIFLISVASETTLAIPAFARKYNMSCQTCHSPFPKLKPYGDEFARNGFVLADKDAPRYFNDTGDDQLSLIRDLPLAIRLEGYATYNLENSNKFDFSAPYILKFLSGGALAKNISYYFYFFFSEKGEVVGVEDAFLMFNNLFDQDLDLYVGQFQVSDPLFKRELRLTFEDYHIYGAKPGYAKADMIYDRGIMLTYKMKTGTDFVVEVLNGNGIGAANNFGIFDDDKYKNVLGRISQDVVEGLRIGAFGYLGKENLQDNFNNKFTNSFTMWGTDITVKYKDKLEMNFQYAQRKDDKPFLASNEINTKGLFGELIFTPLGDESKWYGVAMYNWVDSDVTDLNYKSGTLSLGYLVRRNIRLVGEYTYNFEMDFGQASIGIVSAF